MIDYARETIYRVKRESIFLLNVDLSAVRTSDNRHL
jgi:hypothetical protein